MVRFILQLRRVHLPNLMELREIYHPEPVDLTFDGTVAPMQYAKPETDWQWVRLASNGEHVLGKAYTNRDAAFRARPDAVRELARWLQWWRK